MPIYQGGDITNSPFLSLDKSPTNAADNKIGFLIGSGDDSDDYLLTRQYALWQNRKEITIKRKDYKNINSTHDVYQEPWIKSVQVNGTDGNQFHPNVQKDEILAAYVSDFARTATFTYNNSIFDAYECGGSDAIEMMNYLLNEDLMHKENIENKEIYNTQYDGTVNMNSVLGAQSIATKGHFYQLDDALKNSIPLIKNHSGNVIQTDPNVDETWLGIEKRSGVTLQARQRLQVNFMINGSSTDPIGLFNLFQDDIIIPFAFVQRDSIMTNDQVSQILGQLIDANKTKLPILFAFIGLGLIITICGACRFKKYQQMSRDNHSYDALQRNNLLNETGSG